MAAPLTRCPFNTIKKSDLYAWLQADPILRNQHITASWKHHASSPLSLGMESMPAASAALLLPPVPPLHAHNNKTQDRWPPHESTSALCSTCQDHGRRSAEAAPHPFPFTASSSSAHPSYQMPTREISTDVVTSESVSQV